MKITHETQPYNHRRYSKPWIALVDFTDPIKPTFEFGIYISSRLIISPSPGVIDCSYRDILAVGHKDYRDLRDNETMWFFVNIDGTLSKLYNRQHALDVFNESRIEIVEPFELPEDLMAFGRGCHE